MRHPLLICVNAAAIAPSAHAYAADAKLKESLVEARGALVAMVKDPAKRDAAQQAKVKSTMDTFMKALAAPAPLAGKEAAFKELTGTTATCRATREDELVPARLAGKQAEADRLAGGIRKQRRETMLASIDAM